MKTAQIIFSLTTVFLTHSVMAESNNSVGPPTRDVKVINEDASPIPVTVQNAVQTIVEYRYVGLTTHEDDGNFEFRGLRGIAAMNKACSIEFGPAARVASIAESYFRDDAAADTRTGWLAPGRPMFITVLPRPLTPPTYVALDAVTWVPLGSVERSNLEAGFNAFCMNYRSSDTVFRGPVIDSAGLPGGANCNTINPAACSAPITIAH